MFEKSRIRSHLRKVGKNKTPFDSLLFDYLSGRLKSEFKSVIIRIKSISADYRDDEKYIRVHGKYLVYRVDVDVEIYPDRFTVYIDSCAHGNMTYPLNSSEQVYSTLLSVIKMIHTQFS